MNNEIDMPEGQEVSQPVATKESLVGKLFSFDEMQEITKWHEEEKQDQALEHYYEDFYGFYKKEFPDAYPKPRIRMSEGVGTFFEQSRPSPVEVPWEEAINKIHATKDLSTTPLYDRVRKQSVFVVAEAEDENNKGKGRSSVDLELRRPLQFLFKAEIDKEANQIVFTPEVVNQVATHYGPYGPEKLQAALAKTFGLGVVEVPFPESIRVEHLIAYNSYPSKKEMGVEGPRWELSEVPVARVSFVSEPTASEVDAAKEEEKEALKNRSKEESKPFKRGIFQRLLRRKT